MNELLQALAQRGRVKMSRVSDLSLWRCEVYLHDYPVAGLRSVTSDAFDTAAEAVAHCIRKLQVWDAYVKEEQDNVAED